MAGRALWGEARPAGKKGMCCYRFMAPTGGSR